MSATAKEDATSNNARIFWNCEKRKKTLLRTTARRKNACVNDGEGVLLKQGMRFPILFLLLPFLAEATPDFPSANYVIGQSSFTDTTQTTLTYPAQTAYAGGALFVGLINLGGIAVFNPLPLATTVTPSFYLTGVNITGARLPLSYAVYTIAAGTKLVVSDAVSRRLVIFNSIPTTHDVPYDVVLGQPTFNDGSLLPISSSTVNLVFSLAYANGKLAASDAVWNRVLVWNTVPTLNYTAADYVLGQPNFTSSGLSCSATGLYNPTGLASNGSNLIVVDAFNYRILIWYSFPLSSTTPADVVLGQANMTTCGSHGAS